MPQDPSNPVPDMVVVLETSDRIQFAMAKGCSKTPVFLSMFRVRLPRLYKNSIPSSIRRSAYKCPETVTLKHGRSGSNSTSPFVEKITSVSSRVLTAATSGNRSPAG